MNRFFRRLESFGKQYSARRSKGLMTTTDQELSARGTPQDVSSPRAKSARHKKSTADHWNQ
jgi:hypothetical protein